MLVMTSVKVIIVSFRAATTVETTAVVERTEEMRMRVKQRKLKNKKVSHLEEMNLVEEGIELLFVNEEDEGEERENENEGDLGEDLYVGLDDLEGLLVNMKELNKFIDVLFLFCAVHGNCWCFNFFSEDKDFGNETSEVQGFRCDKTE
ncbi:hypothetical protein PIB30_014096 [Stylosanthes scabra]|uniref:Uncharacterized protein n=1 Tax=Stylosanthes scabra TaxID=79078 RepID=A0ABU6S6S9_9FABA|nr:hypothetical protein [Stylosanthes scabra]